MTFPVLHPQAPKPPELHRFNSDMLRLAVICVLLPAACAWTSTAAQTRTRGVVSKWASPHLTAASRSPRSWPLDRAPTTQRLPPLMDMPSPETEKELTGKAADDAMSGPFDEQTAKLAFAVFGVVLLVTIAGVVLLT